MELRWKEQKCNQVRHLLDCDGGFQAFRHQRKAGAGKLHDVAAEHGLGQTFGALEREARSAFRSDDPVERAAIFCLNDVANEVRRDFAIRVEDVDEHLLRGPLADGGKVWTNVLAKVAGEMAGRTCGLENVFAARRVAACYERQRGN